MAIVTKTVLKSYFETGDVPTQAEFVNLIDTLLSYNAAEISTITEKTTLANDDLFIIEDSAASNAKKKVKKSNLGGSSTKIQSSDTFTYFDSEDATFPNQLIGKTPATGTELMLQIFNDEVTSAPTFQVDASGILANNGVEYYQYINSGTHVFGGGSIYAGTGNNNIFIGAGAGLNYSSAAACSVVGFQAGLNLSTGNLNTIFGYTAGYQTGAGANNTYLGAAAGYDAAGKSGNVRIGYYAGRYTNTSNQFFVGNQNYTNTATELTNTLMVGTFGATPSVQELFFNSQRISMRYLPVSASGLTTGDLWNNAGVLTIA